MQVQLAMLVSDWMIYALFFLAVMGVIYMRRYPHLREPWRYVARRRLAMIAMVILSFYIIVGLLDSIHLRITYPPQQHMVTRIQSVLDLIVSPLGDNDEQTYSAPFAAHLFSQSLSPQA